MVGVAGISCKSRRPVGPDSSSNGGSAGQERERDTRPPIHSLEQTLPPLKEGSVVPPPQGVHEDQRSLSFAEFQASVSSPEKYSFGQRALSFERNQEEYSNAP